MFPVAIVVQMVVVGLRVASHTILVYVGGLVFSLLLGLSARDLSQASDSGIRFLVGALVGFNTRAVFSM